MTSKELYLYIKEGMRLPVCIYKDNKKILPKEEPLQASFIIDGKDSLSSLIEYISKDEELQFFQNSYYENFIYLKNKQNYIILVGPVALEPIRRAAISNLIRNRAITYNKRKVLFDYYSSIIQINDRQFYICGKLIETLLLNHNPSNEINNNNNNLLPIENYQHEVYSFSHSPYFLEQEITKLIATGDTAGARNILSSINTHKRANLAKNNLRSLKNSLICDCTFMTRASITGGVNSEVAFLHSDQFIREIELSLSMDDLNKLELRMIIEFTSLVNDFRQNEYSQTVRSAMNYILSHLKEPLSLSSIAAALFINPSYLSAIFSKETGTTLTRFIKTNRIDESKWNLCYTDNSVANISLIYQFSSQSYYISCFKKLKGETPLQYRKKHLSV